MGASPSNQENKEETTVTKEENKNEVVYNQYGMKVFNVHGETLAISLVGTIAMIFVLVGIYKFVQRRGWWKKKRPQECPSCKNAIPMSALPNMRVVAPTATSPRMVMPTENALEKWSNPWLPSNWPPLRTPSLPPRYCKEYKQEREEGKQRKRDTEPCPRKTSAEKEEDMEKAPEKDWDGEYTKNYS